LAQKDVEAAASMSFSNGTWKDMDTGTTSRLILPGVPLEQRFINNDLIKSGLPDIRSNHAVLVDLYSHKDYGELTVGREVEVNRTPATIAGHFQLGVGLFSEGCIIVSNDNFARLSGNDPRRVNYGFLRLRPGADVPDVVAQLRAMLPGDVFIYSKAEMIRNEQDYFISVKPVGIIFQSGVIVAFFAGIVILLQVLNTDISNRLDEFATLKAIGFGDWYIHGIGVQQALIYSLLSFVPALIIAAMAFRITHLLSRLPMNMTFSLILIVFFANLAMSVISCLIGLQKVRRTDPAELS
jgi:putative ABC transport system permease protein